jgi:hypothetical protein
LEGNRLRTNDSIDNPRLIANGLKHMVYEMTLPAPSYFRIAREAQLVLYRSMVEAVKGTANLAVTGRFPKKPVFKYRQGEEPWCEIHRVEVPGRKKAWRFSIPTPTEPPDPNLPRAEEPEDRLLGFYDVLAMIQAECFMGQVMRGKVVRVDDEAMATLEWLHESIRNVYEHFVPMHYSASVRELLAASDVCLHIAEELLYRSGNVRLEHSVAEELRDLFQRVLSQGSTSGEVM